MYESIPGLSISELGQRINYIITKGREILEDSAVIDPNKSITRRDLKLIDQYHKVVSPLNPDYPWRINGLTKSPYGNRRPIDNSVFHNWEAPGGPLEHIRLAANSAEIITRLLQAHPRPTSYVSNTLVAEKIEELKTVQPLEVAAGAALHDEGRYVTHLFYVNEIMGNIILKRIGVRESLLQLLPDEAVMLTPPEVNMNDVILRLRAGAVVVRLADEFGKRIPKTNKLFTLEELLSRDWQAWADSYADPDKRPLTGLPSDKWLRSKWLRRKIQQHIGNEERYYNGLDNWVQSLTFLSIKDITNHLGRSLTLQPLPELE